jgi:hypothetical protein
VGAARRGALDWTELLADGGGHYVDDVVGVVLLLEIQSNPIISFH